MHEELKPCPFCGGDKFQFDCKYTDTDGDELFGYKITCKFCFATFYNTEWNTDPCEAKQAIIDKWNSRAYESEEDG